MFRVISVIIITAIFICVMISQAIAMPMNWYESTPYSDIDMNDVELVHAVDDLHAYYYMIGYPDKTFRPYNMMTHNQVSNILYRTEMYCNHSLGVEWMMRWANDHSPITRGEIHSVFPQFRFYEERWDECITRSAFARLLARDIFGY